MDVRNCKMCGKLFNYTQGMPICKACEDELEKKFFEVRDYIYANPHASINEVAKENDISVKQIQKWVREERLAFSDDSPVTIACENCGTMIKTGRFCKQCKSSLKNELNSAYYVEPVKEETKRTGNTKGQVRFLNKL